MKVVFEDGIYYNNGLTNGNEGSKKPPVEKAQDGRIRKEFQSITHYDRSKLSPKRRWMIKLNQEPLPFTKRDFFRMPQYGDSHLPLTIQIEVTTQPVKGISKKNRSSNAPRITKKFNKDDAGNYDLGIEKFNNKEYRNAIKYFECFLKTESHAAASYHIGLCLTNLKKYSKAESYLQDAIHEEWGPRFNEEVVRISKDFAVAALNKCEKAIERHQDKEWVEE